MTKVGSPKPVSSHTALKSAFAALLASLRALFALASVKNRALRYALRLAMAFGLPLLLIGKLVVSRVRSG